MNATELFGEIVDCTMSLDSEEMSMFQNLKK